MEKAKESKSAVLSRASLYAPLEAYHQDKVEPSNYLQRQRRIPKSVTENSLFAFYEKVSVGFHRGKHRLDGKNTGGRPLSQQEISDSMGQRSLTLVGGGYHTAVGFSGRKTDIKRRRPRKHQRTSKAISAKMNDDEARVQSTFLKKTNEMWNTYAWGLLNEGKPTISELQAKAYSLSEAMEWVGSKVRLATCHQHKDWIGREGILVEETAMTWRVAVEVISDATAESCFKRLVVPKKGSSLEVLLPMPDSKLPSDDNERTPPRPQSLVIVLCDQRSNHDSYPRAK